MTVSKGASNPAQSRHPVFFYESARRAFVDVLSNLEGGHHHVLLPAFIGWSASEGSGVYDPVDQCGWTADFYRVDRELTTDVVHLTSLLQTNNYDALVLIHYFGRSDRSSKVIREIANAHSIPIIEDLAHAFYTAYARESQAGSIGSVSLYSLHKMLPVPEGGMAVYREPALVRGQSSTTDGVAETLLAYDWRDIARIRRRNFERGIDLLVSLQSRVGGFELPWRELAETDVPQTLPVHILGNGRDAIYHAMNALGFGVVSLYHTLISDIGPEFSTSHWLAEHILNLPVHQDMSPTDMESLVVEFERCIMMANNNGQS